MEQEEESPLRAYILNTSFHGLRFLAEKSRHWTEKTFWFVCCVLSWTGTGLLLHANWDDYQNNAIQFVVDSSYLEWDTAFPSITICETDNQERIADVTDQLYGDPHDYNLDEIVKELVYFRGLSFYTLQICGPNTPPNPDCEMDNFTIFSELVRSGCDQFIKECKWNGAPFDCCKYFKPIDTELGTCYALNSRQTRDDNVPFYKMISNRKSGPGTFYVEIYGIANVYILGEQEVPSLTTLQTDVLQVTSHIHFHRYMAITEIDNQPEVREVGIRQRNCRFMDENYLNVYRHYSYSACCVQCRKDAQLEKCDCAHHLMPHTDPKKQCKLEGLECLNKNYNDLAVLKAQWAKRNGLVCYCVPSCTEVEMTVVKDDKSGIEHDFAIVELSLERLPAERFKRNVVKDRLDLVVSMGGTTALFIGASILSLVELVYYFTLRPLSNYCIRKKEREVSRIDFMQGEHDGHKKKNKNKVYVQRFVGGLHEPVKMY